MAAIPTPEKRREAHLTVALVSVLLAYLFHVGGEHIADWYNQNYHQSIPDWVGWMLELSSPMVVFGLLSKLFEEQVWKWRGIRAISGLCPPIIEGEWDAEFRSSFDEYQTAYPAKVTIKQSWSALSITLEADKSRSQSEVAAINADDGGTCWLVYEYLNEPRLEAIETMHTHRGTARLEIKTNDLLDGDYYTGRDRKTFGTLKFKRVPKK